MIHHVNRALLIAIGSISLILGAIGVVMPLLPTTPFVLLAALCFSRSSRRMDSWLRVHKLFGPIITDWEDGQVIAPKVKWTATIMMVLMTFYPIVYTIEPMWLKLVVVASLLAVNLFIWTRPSRRPD